MVQEESGGHSGGPLSHRYHMAAERHYIDLIPLGLTLSKVHQYIGSSLNFSGIAGSGLLCPYPVFAVLLTL